MPIPSPLKEAARAWDTRIWAWKESWPQPCWQIGRREVKGNILALHLDCESSLEWKDYSPIFLSSKPKNITSKWTQYLLCDNVIFFGPCGCLSDNDVDRDSNDYGKEAKGGERREKTPTGGSAELRPWVKGAFGVKYFVLWTKVERHRNYTYSSLKGWAIFNENKEELMNALYVSIDSQALPHVIHQISQGLSILCQLFTSNWVPEIWPFLRSSVKGRLEFAAWSSVSEGFTPLFMIADPHPNGTQ